uniref:Uncharacterized protein n=1 Tax=Gadus morhua TaxID=8049 RepID=A0A8C5C7Y4_GADMO
MVPVHTGRSLSSHTSQSPAVFCLLSGSGLKPPNRQAGKYSPNIPILSGYYTVLRMIYGSQLPGSVVQAERDESRTNMAGEARRRRVPGTKVPFSATNR